MNSSSQHLKSIVNDLIKPELLQPVSEEQDDLKFLDEGKSYLLDQQLEIDF
jgi:hypothetical protein